MRAKDRLDRDAPVSVGVKVLFRPVVAASQWQVVASSPLYAVLSPV